MSGALDLNAFVQRRYDMEMHIRTLDRAQYDSYIERVKTYVQQHRERVCRLVMRVVFDESNCSATSSSSSPPPPPPNQHLYANDCVTAVTTSTVTIYLEFPKDLSEFHRFLFGSYNTPLNACSDIAKVLGVNEVAVTQRNGAQRRDQHFGIYMDVARPRAGDVK